MLLYSKFVARCARRAYVAQPIARSTLSCAVLSSDVLRRLEQVTVRSTTARHGPQHRLLSSGRKQHHEVETESRRSNVSDGTGHHDLRSYLLFTDRESLDTSTTVYKGTMFEYSVAEALRPFGMALERVGKANDLGIDLLGEWLLPELTVVPVLLQCKISKALPQVVRELEGSCSSAPAKWSGSRRLALLASQHPASPGVIRALQKSPLSMGFVQINSDGLIKQFLWNASAAEKSLSGLGITMKHIGDIATSSSRNRAATDQSSVALTWKSKPLRVQRVPGQRS